MKLKKFAKSVVALGIACGITLASFTAMAADTIKVGVLHSLSGTMAISETTLKDTMLMLIEEQNKKGGLLGKKLEAVVVDPASNWPLFAEKTRELIAKDKVAAIKEEKEIAGTTAVKDTAKVNMPIANEDLIDKIIQSAFEKIGARYRSGGTTTAGFDCSGLMFSTFGGFDIKLPRSSIEQSAVGERIDNGNAQKGDLNFFKTNGRRHINHVGMIVEVNEGEIKFMHSSTHSGVIVSSLKEPYYQRNFAQVNRVIK